MINTSTMVRKIIDLWHSGWFAVALFGVASSYANAAGICPKPSIEMNGPVGQPFSLDEGRGRERLLYEESHALLIGESKYAKSSGWRALDSVPGDLSRLSAVLNEQGFHVVRHDDLASDELALAIECFVKAYGYRRDARIVIYFTGHGFTRVDSQSTGDRTIGYVLPIDAPRQPADSGGPEETALIAKALRLSQFQEWATAMEARHVMLIFDSCFSGSILGHKGGIPNLPKPQPLNYVLSQAAQSPVRWFLTSGSANQTVPAESYFNSLLVQALTGLRPEADVNKDGFLTSNELVTYIKVTVPSYNVDQTPDEGKIHDPLLNVGDMAFRLPDRKSAAAVARSAAGSKLLWEASSDPALPMPVVNAIARLPVAAPAVPIVLPSSDQESLVQAVTDLEIDNTPARRKARATLAKLIGDYGEQFVGELVRGLPHGSYRFQLGVAEALSNVRGGWRANDQEMAVKIVGNLVQVSRDLSLKQALSRALRNAQR